MQYNVFENFDASSVPKVSKVVSVARFLRQKLTVDLPEQSYRDSNYLCIV